MNAPRSVARRRNLIVVATVTAALWGPGAALAQGIVDGFGRGLGEGIGRGLGEILREGVRPPPPASDPGSSQPGRSEPAPPRTLARAEVVELQRHLIALGHLRDVADGIAGPNTQQAVRDFQRARGLPVDGRPTADVLQATRQAVAAAPPPSGPAPAARPTAPPPTPVAPAPTLRVQPAPGVGPYVMDIGRAAQPSADLPDETRRVLARFLIGLDSTLLDSEGFAVAAAALLLPDEAAPFFGRTPVGRPHWGFWAGDTEFAQERARSGFRRDIVPRLAAQGARGAPLSLRIRSDATLLPWDSANRALGLRSVLLTVIGGQQMIHTTLLPGAQRSPFQLDLDVIGAVADRIVGDAAAAEAIVVAARPGRRVTLVVDATLRPQLLHRQDQAGRITGARLAAEAISATLHADADGEGPALATLPIAAPPQGAALAAAAGAPAEALMLRPHEEARPGERGDDPALRTLARSVLTAEPSLLDEPDVLLAAARHLIDQRTQTYLRGGTWAGAGQAERARRELPALLAADAPSFPLTALWITPLSVMAHYDETQGGLRIINPHQWRLAVERALDPIYSLRTTIGLDRGAPTVLPAADRAAATALFASLPSRAPPGIGRADQARTVFLKTLVRFDPPQIVDGPRAQRWVHLRGSVLDQAIYAEPALTTRLVDRAALDPTRREAALVAGFAADPPAPEALLLDAERGADTLALLRLRAGATFADLALPGLESEAGAWLRAYASEAERQGFAWPAVVTPQQVSTHHGVTDADRRPLEAAFMAWNARRLAVLPETMLHRHRTAIAPPFTEAKRVPLLAEALRADRPEARTPPRPGAPPPGTLFRFAPGTPDALEIDGEVMARLGRGPAEVETRLRIVDAAMEDGVAIVTVAVVSATARIGEAVVARLGAAPAVAAPAVGAASRLAVLDLRPGASAEAARAALERHFGEERVVARLLGRTMTGTESGVPGMPRRGLMMARPDGSDRVAVFAAETGGPAVAILRALTPAHPVPLAEVLSGLEAQYGAPDLRRDEQPVRTAAGMRPSRIELGWSEGSARPELAAIARERAACVVLFDDTREEVWWWREDTPRFGLARGIRGPAGPRWWADRQREVDCGTTLRVALELEAESGRVTRLTALVADPRVLRAITLDAMDREEVGTIGILAEGMPDVVGITVGMAWEEALRVAEAHLGEALRVDFAPAPALDPEARREYETGTILVRRDLMEAIGLYREPPEAADRVVAVTRRLLVPAGQVDPRRIAAALTGKYGEPDRRSGGLFHWGVAGEDDVVCGETLSGGLPMTADRSALPQQPAANTVLEAVPVPRLAGSLDGVRRLDPPTLLARDAVLLACPPVIGARIQPSISGGLIEVDQWALDIGGYLGLLDRARDAATRPAAPSGGPAAAPVPFRL